MTSISFDIGHRVRPISGEIASGDLAMVSRTQSGVLVALIDGLGHGRSAAEAASLCARTIDEHREQELDEIFSIAHRVLRTGRGAVAAIARLDAVRREIEFAGIGNIATTIVHANKGSGASKVSPLTMAGVLGSAYRKIRSQRLPFDAGDAVLMHTDGVRSRFDPIVIQSATAQSAADEIISVYGKDTDDAGCLFVRAVSAKPAASSSHLRAAEVSSPSLPSSSSMPVEAEVFRTIPLRVVADAQVVALETRRLAADLGTATRAQWEAGIAASELASLAIQYGVDGVLTLKKIRRPNQSIEIELVDRGSGLRALASLLSERGAVVGSVEKRTSAIEGVVVGLGSALRLMDSIEVITDATGGLRIIARKKVVDPRDESSGARV
ncbi:MAG: SpoIIE family protein phosphatase [Polyangiaceae bacterium]